MRQRFSCNSLLVFTFLVFVSIVSTAWRLNPEFPQDPGHSNGSKLLTYDWEIYGLETVNVGDQAVVYEAWPKEESSVSPGFWVVNGGHITLIREGKWKIEVDWDYPGTGSVSVYSSDSSLLVSMPVTVNGSIMP